MANDPQKAGGVSFSRRTDWDLSLTPWALLREKLQAANSPVHDLTVSNPARCGFDYDAAYALEPLADSRVLSYEPSPWGMKPAREAIARYYRERGAAVSAENILLTASTSEAYSYLFRLLAGPGDEILIAQPSYPLFDFLARLDDVQLTPYPLLYDHGWQIDLAELRRRITPRTKAISLVHPNNPTGHFTRPSERAVLEEECRRHGLGLIVDEVFLDYAFSDPGKSFATGAHPALTFVLSGLSKVAALPQMKAAWIACLGEGRELTAARDRLEMIADTFLSVSAPVQCALEPWLDRSPHMREQVRRRTAANLAALDDVLSRQKLVSRLETEGGWYAILRIPALMSGVEAAQQLLERHRVAVHPGEFFGFAGGGWMVISLLPQLELFRSGAKAFACYFM